MTHANAYARSSHPTRPTPSRLLARLDGERIAASSGAIAINVAVAMLMLVPLAAPQLLPKATTETQVVWLPRDPTPRIDPIPVPVTSRPMPAQTQSPTLPRQAAAPPVATAPRDAGEIALPVGAPAVDPDVMAASSPSTSIAAAQAGAQLQYALAPPPAYPREALRAGHRGTVLLQVLVDTDGKPLQVDVARSSGHRSLDRTAQRHVLTRWTFRPAVQDGRPVQAIGLVPVEFALR